MPEITTALRPPYYAVIFTSIRSKEDDEGYSRITERMLQLAAEQEGFLGVDSARAEVGITVSYWTSMEAIRRWKGNVEHLEAQRLGRDLWYSAFSVHIAKVEMAYGK